MITATDIQTLHNPGLENQEKVSRLTAFSSGSFPLPVDRSRKSNYKGEFPIERAILTYYENGSSLHLNISPESVAARTRAIIDLCAERPDPTRLSWCEAHFQHEYRRIVFEEMRDGKTEILGRDLISDEFQDIAKSAFSRADEALEKRYGKSDLPFDSAVADAVREDISDFYKTRTDRRYEVYHAELKRIENERGITIKDPRPGIQKKLRKLKRLSFERADREIAAQFPIASKLWEASRVSKDIRYIRELSKKARTSVIYRSGKFDCRKMAGTTLHLACDYPTQAWQILENSDVMNPTGEQQAAINQMLDHARSFVTWLTRTFPECAVMRILGSDAKAPHEHIVIHFSDLVLPDLGISLRPEAREKELKSRGQIILNKWNGMVEKRWPGSLTKIYERYCAKVILVKTADHADRLLSYVPTAQNDRRGKCWGARVWWRGRKRFSETERRIELSPKQIPHVMHLLTRKHRPKQWSALRWHASGREEASAIIDAVLGRKYIFASGFRGPQDDWYNPSRMIKPHCDSAPKPATLIVTRNAVTLNIDGLRAPPSDLFHDYDEAFPGRVVETRRLATDVKTVPCPHRVPYFDPLEVTRFRKIESRWSYDPEVGRWSEDTATRRCLRTRYAYRDCATGDMVYMSEDAFLNRHGPKKSEG